MPVTRAMKERLPEPCSAPSAIEVTVAVGADYTRILTKACLLTFAADGAVAALALGVANTVGVVDADGEGLPVACVVGKVLHGTSRVVYRINRGGVRGRRI